MYNNDYNLDRLNRQKSEIESLIRNYQQSSQPLTNIQEMYEVKILNESDEAENIFIKNNTIFLGSNRMQIKKLDGTIEKYNIDKYYPVDEKDEKIKELNKKVEELERRLNNEHTKSTESVERINKPVEHDDEFVDTRSKTSSKSNTKQI